MTHFKQLAPRKLEPEYERADPLVGRWKPIRGFSDPGHFRCIIDLMEHANVIWRSYESR
jgi:hypothetical protein